MFSSNKLLELQVAERILKVVDGADKLTRSDLQGVAQAEAKKIIIKVREEKKWTKKLTRH